MEYVQIGEKPLYDIDGKVFLSVPFLSSDKSFSGISGSQCMDSAQRILVVFKCHNRISLDAHQ